VLGDVLPSTVCVCSAVGVTEANTTLQAIGVLAEWGAARNDNYTPKLWAVKKLSKIFLLVGEFSYRNPKLEAK